MRLLPVTYLRAAYRHYGEAIHIRFIRRLEILSLVVVCGVMPSAGTGRPSESSRHLRLKLYSAAA